MEFANVDALYRGIHDHTLMFKRNTAGFSEGKRIRNSIMYVNCIEDLDALSTLYREYGFLPESGIGASRSPERDAVLTELAGRIRMCRTGFTRGEHEDDRVLARCMARDKSVVDVLRRKIDEEMRFKDALERDGGPQPIDAHLFTDVSGDGADKENESPDPYMNSYYCILR